MYNEALFRVTRAELQRLVAPGLTCQGFFSKRRGYLIQIFKVHNRIKTFYALKLDYSGPIPKYTIICLTFQIYTPKESTAHTDISPGLEFLGLYCFKWQAEDYIFEYSLFYFLKNFPVFRKLASKAKHRPLPYMLIFHRQGFVTWGIF